MIARCTWDAVAGVDGYNVYLKSNGVFVKQNTGLITELTYDIEDLSDGDYEAYVRSVKNGIESPVSNVESFFVGVDISFVASSDVVILDSDTSLSVTVPATVEEGDLLVFHIMHRSDITLPSGWILLGTSPGTIASNQLESVITKVATSSDASSEIIVTQASSNRFIGNISAYRSPDPISILTSSFVDSVSVGLSPPQLTADRDNQLAIVSMTSVFVFPTNPTELSYTDASYTQITIESTVQNRLAVAYKVLVNEESITGRFDTSADDNDRTAVSIILTN